MYKFIDTNERVPFERLPSEALFINGKSIEEELSGYRTLTVTGRELIGRELVTERRSGGHGDLFVASSYPSRTITVTYQLIASDNEFFRKKFELLNELLSGEQLKIQFADDYEYHYIGTLSTVGEVPEGLNTVVGSFSFYCSDPFKYKNDIIVEGGQSVSTNLGDLYPMTPSKIKVTPTATVNTLTIKSGDKQIRLSNGSFTGGRTYLLDFDEQEITSNGVSVMDKLDLASNFEDFIIKSNQPITLVESGNIELTVRQVAL